MIRRWFVSSLVVLLLGAAVPVAGAADPVDGKTVSSDVTGAGDSDRLGITGVTSGVRGLEPGLSAGDVEALAGNSAFPDAYEPDGDYNGVPWASIRNIELLLPRWHPMIPGWGMDPHTEQHTIDTANVTEWDEDWYKLVVPDSDFDTWSQLSYRFDAFAMDRTVDLVLDVYADGSPFTFADLLSGEDPHALVSNDDALWGYYSNYERWGRWSSVTFIPPSAGTYWIRVRPYWEGPGTGFSGHAGPYEFRAKVGQVMRLAGATRISTAVRVSQEGWPSVPPGSAETTVVLAYSDNYPDALAAASLAGACGGPILLTRQNRLPDAVRDEILRIGARGVYVVGGPAAVGDEVITALQAVVPPSRIVRVAGDTRYTTAVEVLKKTKAVLEAKGDTMPRVAFLVSGQNFPDALAVGPSSYHNAAPILLTRQGSLHPASSAAIAMYNINDVIIGGGTSAVSAAVGAALVDQGIPPNRILRIAGVNRYETAKEVAAWACDLKGPGILNNGTVGTVNNSSALMALQNCYLNAYASGADYPDALAGGAFAGKARAPILLTPKSIGTPFLFGADGEIPAGSSQWFADLAVNGQLPIEQSYLLGGTAAVSDDVFTEIDNNTGWAP